MLHLRNLKGIFILCHLKGFRASVDHCSLCICPPCECFPDGLADTSCILSQTVFCLACATLRWYPPAGQAPLSPAHPSSISSRLNPSTGQTQDHRDALRSLLGVVWLTQQHLLFSKHIFSSPHFCFSWWKQSFAIHAAKYLGEGRTALLEIHLESWCIIALGVLLKAKGFSGCLKPWLMYTHTPATLLKVRISVAE